jgi:hypothetical protein
MSNNTAPPEIVTPGSTSTVSISWHLCVTPTAAPLRHAPCSAPRDDGCCRWITLHTNILCALHHTIASAALTDKWLFKSHTCWAHRHLRLPAIRSEAP